MNTFILRWNPAISSYKMEEHKKICERLKNEVVFYNWSVREWENLHAGDAFVLLQVGTENDGIAMIGKFISEPYESDSWRKDGTNNPVVHIGEEDGWNWLFDEEEFAIEMIW